MANNPEAAAKTAGIMSHYIADMAVFGHVMGEATDWGEEKHHSDYEDYVNTRTNRYNDDFNIYLSFDGSLDEISAYETAVKLAYDTTFDVDGDFTCVWMDQNYNWDNQAFRNRCGESLNLAVNLVADVLHTLYVESFTVSPTPTLSPTPTPSPTPMAIPAPTPTPTVTPTVTPTPTPQPTPAPSPSPTPSPTPMPAPTPATTPIPTPTPKPTTTTPTPSPTLTPAPPQPSPTQTPTLTPMPSPYPITPEAYIAGALIAVIALILIALTVRRRRKGRGI